MANFTRLRAPGFWVVGSVVLPEEFEAFDDEREAVINARDGSTHAPTVQIELGGQGLRVTGPSRLDDITLGVVGAAGTLSISNTADLIVENGGDAIVQAGGDLDIGTGVGLANLTVKSGSLATIASGGSMDVRGAVTYYDTSVSTYNGTSTLILNVDGVWTLSGLVTFASSTYPLLSPARSWERHSLLIASTTFVGTAATAEPAAGALDPDAYKINSNLAGGMDAIATRPTTSTSRYHEVELLDLPDGGTFIDVQVYTQGMASTVTMTLPVYEIFRQSGTAAAQSMSAATTDAHTVGNFTAGVATTTVTVTAFATISKSYRYFLRVSHGYDPGAPTGSMRIYDVKATGTASRLGL